MITKNLKILVLYLAGIFLLGHNFVPHHHHESSSDESFFSHKEEHSPLHNEHSHDDEETNDNSLNYIFSHFQHQNNTNEITYVVKAQCNELSAPCFLLPELYTGFGALRIPPKIIPPPEEITNHFYDSPPTNICFRGPPVCV